MFRTGLHILVDSDDEGTEITSDDIRFTYRDADGNVVGSLAEADAIQINMHLAKTVQFTVGVDFAGSLPGLGLDVDADLNVRIGFDFEFGFGLSITDLFYFDVARENELIAGMSATFTDGASLDVTLGFLVVQRRGPRRHAALRRRVHRLERLRRARPRA